MQTQIDAIYHFWFGDMLTNPDAADRSQFWFMGGETVDSQIREQFSGLAEQAQSGALADWQATARGSLALIILLDQFPLNIYRGEARAYTSEQYAVSICLDGIANGQDRALSFNERVFFYLPLEHSENAEHQLLSLQHYTALRDEAPTHLKAKAEGNLTYAVDHKTIIDQFGRYPHRNKALGRTSTAEEIAFLEGGGATFGQ